MKLRSYYYKGGNMTKKKDGKPTELRGLPKPKKRPKAKITKEKERQWLRCKLTEKELLTAARGSSAALIKRGQLEDQLRGIKEKFKSDIETANHTMKKNSQLVEDGYEYRTVDTIWTKNWEKGTKSCVRQDTGEVIGKDVKLEDGERQTSLL